MEEEKVQAAKAKVKKQKVEESERKALRGPRAVSAYVLFVKDQIKTVSHVPVGQRFQVSSHPSASLSQCH